MEERAAYIKLLLNVVKFMARGMFICVCHRGFFCCFFSSSHSHYNRLLTMKRKISLLKLRALKKQPRAHNLKGGGGGGVRRHRFDAMIIWFFLVGEGTTVTLKEHVNSGFS